MAENLAQRLYRASKRERYPRGWVMMAQLIRQPYPIGAMDENTHLHFLADVPDTQAREEFARLIRTETRNKALPAIILTLALEE